METEFRQECGEKGDWKVTSFTVTKDDVMLTNLRYIRDGYPERCIHPGTYYRLSRKGVVVMSNTPAELMDMFPLRIRGRGHVLISGLGLGISVFELLKIPEVTMITVIEKSQDVVDLCAGIFKGNPKVEIICADAFEWQPPKDAVYDFAWHDIWDDITSDNLPQMGKLHRKYGRKVKIQASWCKRECERMKRQEKRDEKERAMFQKAFYPDLDLMSKAMELSGSVGGMKI